MSLSNCVVCSNPFAELDTPIKCDSCSGAFHTKCTGLSSTEIKCLSLKNRSLKYFCSTCEQGLKELPELKLLIKKLLVEVEGLKNCPLQRPNNEVCNEFIINEINERNRRAANLICYNVIESDSNQSDDRIAHDREHINNFLATIAESTNSVPVPIKVIRIGRYQSNKPRPLIITFGSVSDAFNIMKNKTKLLSRYPMISLSSDRTQYQRDHMKKLREELASRISKGEIDLTIKFIRGVPTIIQKSIINNVQNPIKNF
ncbi:unnamed protein product [Macrosiphum euphorbiae]|uniref:PHD-type domain-containing protein n=1 Tax=Macrosiphum euphorbiae TaxID=13131 RepID=A0AAV0W4I7_9HEMI|nr:unnamed protein product [Macrosiphum euphorbiae]